MVRLGKMFHHKHRDDASKDTSSVTASVKSMSKWGGKKFGRSKKVPAPTELEVVTGPVTDGEGDPAASAAGEAQGLQTSGNGKGWQPAVASAPSPISEVSEEHDDDETERGGGARQSSEERDAAPSPPTTSAAAMPFPTSTDPVGVRASKLMESARQMLGAGQLLGAAPANGTGTGTSCGQSAPGTSGTSASAEEGLSYEETDQTSGEDAGSDAGSPVTAGDAGSTVYEEGGEETGGEETSAPGDEEEEEEEEEEGSCFNRGTLDERTREGYDTGSDLEDCTRAEGDATCATGRSTLGTRTCKKYFHKDVVLNSLEDGANSLVIRAMYFIPKPKAPHHAVVKIEASTISPRDCMRCRGHGVTAAMLPFVPGFEVVGTVQTLGHKAQAAGQLREGDRVAGLSTFGGGNSRFISFPADRLIKITADVKSTQAVCLIGDYMAALRALRLAKKAGSPFTGMNVLVTDGFSPVGQAVVVLAGMEGANIYCCADESKHAYLTSLGVKCFPREPDAWLPNATGTFDIVIDNSCVDAYSSSWFALNPRGSLVAVAPVYDVGADDDLPRGCGIVDTAALHQKWAALKARYMMSQTSFLDTEACFDDDTEQYKQDLRYLLFLLERGSIKPKVAERVSLDDVPDAQRLMQSGRANGTVVCVPWIEG